MARRNVTGRVTEPRAQKSRDIAAGARWMVIAGHHECDAWDLGGASKRGQAMQRISESRPRSREVFVTGACCVSAGEGAQGRVTARVKRQRACGFSQRIVTPCTSVNQR
jgi:hypothetical protein